MFAQLPYELSSHILSYLSTEYRTLYRLLTVSRSTFSFVAPILYHDPFQLLDYHDQPRPKMSTFSILQLHYLLTLCSGFQAWDPNNTIVPHRPPWDLKGPSLPTFINYYDLIPLMPGDPYLYSLVGTLDQPINQRTNYQCFHAEKIEKIIIPLKSFPTIWGQVKRFKVLKAIELTTIPRTSEPNEKQVEMLIEFIENHKKLYPGKLQSIQLAGAIHETSQVIRIQRTLKPSKLNLQLGLNINYMFREFSDLFVAATPSKTGTTSATATTTLANQTITEGLKELQIGTRVRYQMTEIDFEGFLRLCPNVETINVAQWRDQGPMSYRLQPKLSPKLPFAPVKNLTLNLDHLAPLELCMEAYKSTLEYVSFKSTRLLGHDRTDPVPKRGMKLGDCEDDHVADDNKVGPWKFPKLKYLSILAGQLKLGSFEDCPNLTVLDISSQKVDWNDQSGGAEVWQAPIQLCVLHLSGRVARDLDLSSLKRLKGLQDLSLGYKMQGSETQFHSPPEQLRSIRFQDWCLPNLKHVKLGGQPAFLFQLDLLQVGPRIESYTCSVCTDREQNLAGAYGISKRLDPFPKPIMVNTSTSTTTTAIATTTIDSGITTTGENYHVDLYDPSIPGPFTTTFKHQTFATFPHLKRFDLRDFKLENNGSRQFLLIDLMVSGQLFPNLTELRLESLTDEHSVLPNWNHVAQQLMINRSTKLEVFEFNMGNLYSPLQYSQLGFEILPVNRNALGASTAILSGQSHRLHRNRYGFPIMIKLSTNQILRRKKLAVSTTTTTLLGGEMVPKDGFFSWSLNKNRNKKSQGEEKEEEERQEGSSSLEKRKQKNRKTWLEAMVKTFRK